MKKIFLLTILVIATLFIFVPVNTNALSISDYVYYGVNTPPITNISDVSDLNDDYNNDMNCTGNDSLLGDPNDDSSVAWLLDKILTYSTLIGMVLVVVLSSVDFLKVIVNSSDDDMAKAIKKLGIRLICAILLFFVPTLTNALLDLFGLTSESTCGIQQ